MPRPIKAPLPLCVLTDPGSLLSGTRGPGLAVAWVVATLVGAAAAAAAPSPLLSETATGEVLVGPTKPRIDLAKADSAEPAPQRGAVGKRRPRPAWLEQGPTPNPDATTAVLNAGPHVTRQACEEEGDRELWAWVTRLLADRYQSGIPAETPARFGLSTRELRELVVRDRYEEVIDSSVATGMHRLHVLVELDRQDADQLARRAHQAALAIRRTLGLRRIALVAAGLLTTLALAYGVLRASGRSRGCRHAHGR